jgi:DNA repair exonuclease SbcCD ATPase subunit
MGHGPRGGPGMDSENAVEAMEFDSEEEELEFLVERTTESISHRIEKLNDMLENIDEIDNEDITEESIDEQITELETLLEEVEAATSVDELKEIMEEARDSMMPGMKGEKPEMEEMEFESEEEEMEFLLERETESISHRIEKLNDMLENVDEIDNEDITEESIEEQITELEALREGIESATTLDKLKEILEEYRENNPQPHGHGGERGPMDFSSEEEVTAE